MESRRVLDIKKLSKRELFLLVLLGAIFPIYPAILLQKAIHGTISVSKIVLVSMINAFLVPFFAYKGLSLMTDMNITHHDIRHYLDTHYSEEEQQNIIKNYRLYKSEFFQQFPRFRIEPLAADPVLQSFEKNVCKITIKTLGGLVFYALLLILTFCLFIFL